MPPRASSRLEGEHSGRKPERLQKVLAHAGLGSRRECEEYIVQGRVTVDGKVVRELGAQVNAETAGIAVDGEKIRLERLVYYAVNKPKGYVSTNDDPAGRPRVIDLLPEVPERVYSVGRLDEDSTGLMILTNDGELANRLAHPRYGVEKTYRALVAGRPEPSLLGKLTEGIWLSDGKVRAKRARFAGTQGEATVLELVLAEGKKREIRRMLAKFGHKVMSLTRIAIGPIVLRGLPVGEHRPLIRAEVELLQKVAAGIAVPSLHERDASPRPGGRPPQPGRPPGRPGPARKSGMPPRPVSTRPEEERPAQTRRPGASPRPRPAGPGASMRPRPAGPGEPVRRPRPAAPGAQAGTPRPAPARRPGPIKVSRPAAPAQPPVDGGDQSESKPRRRIVGLPPRVAAEAGLTRGGPPPRKRPGIKRRPPRAAAGMKRAKRNEADG